MECFNSSSPENELNNPPTSISSFSFLAASFILSTSLLSSCTFLTNTACFSCSDNGNAPAYCLRRAWRGGEEGKREREGREREKREKRKEKEKSGEGRRRGRKGKRGGGGEGGGRVKEVDTLKDLKVLSCNVHLTGSESVCKAMSICPLVYTWTVSLKCRIFPWDSALT